VTDDDVTPLLIFAMLIILLLIADHYITLAFPDDE